MNWQVPLADLDYNEDEEQAVLKVLRSRWLTMGEVTQHFEEEFAAMTGSRYALAVSNATVALHLACLALDIGPGDEVIVPSLTFVATANAVLYTGAQVRFADILGPEEPNIDPSEIDRLVTPRTKAVIVMHYGGYPCRMPEILERAKKYNLRVIEDAAHSPGGSLGKLSLGAWGDIGCFSFFSNKNLSTGEGGMLTTNDEALAHKLRLKRSHGMTSLTWDRHQGHAYSYDVVDLGYNYRMDEIHAALGIVQLHKLARNNARRKEISQQYWQAFQDSELGLPFHNWAKQEEVHSACHIFPIVLPEDIQRKSFIDKMRAYGIQTSIHYPPIHQFKYYKQIYPNIRLAHTEAFAAHEVTLPLYPGMTSNQLSLVIKSVNQSLFEQR
jgi:dTDP-4-amino-4,6-dideoxygalactose transaminase